MGGRKRWHVTRGKRRENEKREMIAIVLGDKCDVRSHSKEWKTRLETKNWYVTRWAERLGKVACRKSDESAKWRSGKRSKLSLAYLTNSLDPVRLVQNLRVLHACLIHFLPHDGSNLKRKERASFNNTLPQAGDGIRVILHRNTTPIWLFPLASFFAWRKNSLSDLT